MSTITKERLTELSRRENVGAILGEEIAELARIALASLEAEPVAWLLSGGGAKNHVSFDSSNAYADPLREVTPLYTAPPAPVSVPDEHNSVIAEQLAHVLSGMDVTDHQRAIINCAVDRLNKNAEVIQQKPVYSEVPEALDYQGAKELYNYLMNEEETNATVNGWNACRAAMLQGAEPVSNRDELPDVELDTNESDRHWYLVSWHAKGGYAGFTDIYLSSPWANGSARKVAEIISELNMVTGLVITSVFPMPAAPQQELKP